MVSGNEKKGVSTHSSIPVHMEQISRRRTRIAILYRLRLRRKDVEL